MKISQITIFIFVASVNQSCVRVSSFRLKKNYYRDSLKNYMCTYDKGWGERECENVEYLRCPKNKISYLVGGGVKLISCLASYLTLFILSKFARVDSIVSCHCHLIHCVFYFSKNAIFSPQPIIGGDKAEW